MNTNFTEHSRIFWTVDSFFELQGFAHSDFPVSCPQDILFRLLLTFKTIYLYLSTAYTMNSVHLMGNLPAGINNDTHPVYHRLV